ncbi:Wzz/FepE/Etk N-terminal domain-containing protein [Paracidovorax wautersii]|uniref:Wzz/FepE/Etk N-terminal domain-containing protein n=1 Tax=Paracidovorax wautersii TaxID=1177982 RepID=UPI0031DCE6DA
MSTIENQPHLDAATSVDDDGISLLDMLQVIADNLRLLVLGPLLVGLVALGISFTIRPTFTASTKFLPPQQQQGAAASMLQSLGALGGLAGAATGLKNPSDQYVAFLKTRSVQDALIQRFDLQQRYEKEYLESTRKELEKNSLVSAGKDNIITIQVDDKDPKVATDMANAYIEELGHLLDRLAVTEAQQRRLFFEKQLSETKLKLNDAEKALAASGVSAAALNSNPVIALEGPARLRAQATAQEVKIASMRSYLTERAPEFRQALSELSALRTQLAKAEKEQASGNNASGSGDYINKYREYKYQETLLELFTRQFELAKVDESREGAIVQVIDTAQIPERKSKPTRSIIAIGSAVVALFLLLIFVFTRNALHAIEHDPVKSPRIARLRQSVRAAFWK